MKLTVFKPLLIAALYAGLLPAALLLGACNQKPASKKAIGTARLGRDSALLKPAYPAGEKLTAEARKKINDSFLKSIPVPVLESFPVTYDYTTAKLRSSADVAKRCIILHALLYAAYNEGTSAKIITYLQQYGLWDAVSPEEKKYLASGAPAGKEQVNITWRSEGLNVLYWALDMFDTLPLPLHECDLQKFDKIPGPGTNPAAWIAAARLRNTEDILNETDLIIRIHWATTEARLHQTPMPYNLNNDVVYERHYAFNWLTMYGDNWDDISTDT